MMSPPTIIVHGGAGTFISGLEVHVDIDGVLSGVEEAARAGYKHLTGETSSAIDAVEAAVCSLGGQPFVQCRLVHGPSCV